MSASWLGPCAVGGAWATFLWLFQGVEPGERQKALDRMVAIGKAIAGRARAVGIRLVELVPLAPDAAYGRASLGEISEMIDVVRLGLSAGLSFDAALELYCANRAGCLADLLSEARMSWQMGLGTREEELSRVARVLGERALESFAATVSQALGLGAPLSETLAGQSREIRLAHRADVEREIERIPVKLLIPTGTLILPALLLSIVGPLLAASGML